MNNLIGDRPLSLALDGGIESELPEVVDETQKESGMLK